MTEVDISFSTLQIVCYAMRGIFDVVFPFVVFFFLHRRCSGRVYPALIGIAALVLLVVPRALLREMFVPSEGEFLLQFAISALINAVCEEMARYCAMRWAMPHHDRLLDGLCYGIGHGGMEVVVNSSAQFTILETVLLYQEYGASYFTAGKTSEEAAATLAMLQNYADCDVFQTTEVIMGTVLALVNHMAWSVLILTAHRYGRPKFIALAILLHMLSHFAMLLGFVPMLIYDAASCWWIYWLVRPYWTVQYEEA